jgi:hypothetical protein
MSSTEKKENDKLEDAPVPLNTRETGDGGKSTLGGRRSVAERHARGSQREQGHRMSILDH